MKENQKIMASKASGSRRLKKNTLPKFETDVYSKIPSGELIVFAVDYLIEQKIEITLEDIVSVCFLLFPRKFGLKKYQKWPDSALVGRRWSNVRRKRYIAANPDLGYRLTSKGLSLIKKVGKALGVAKPKPVAKAQPLQPQKKILLSVKKTQSTVNKKKAARPVEKTKVVIPSAPVIKLIKKTQALQKQKKSLGTPIKKEIPVDVKKISSAPVMPERKAPSVAQKKKTEPAQKKKVTQLELIPAQVKKAKPIAPVIVQSVKVEKTQAEKADYVTANHVTKEAKERAAKFTRMMERSDTYLQYKKNGKNSKIGEFDFRSLLLCTMESSAETLARNVELFKGYAEIHHRQDLIVFLNFCEDKFSNLLKPQNKSLRKAKK